MHQFYEPISNSKNLFLSQIRSIESHRRFQTGLDCVRASNFQCSGSSSFSSSYEYPQFFVLVQWLRATISYHFLKKISACAFWHGALCVVPNSNSTKMMVRRVFSACGLKLNDINIMSNKTSFVPSKDALVFLTILCKERSVGLVVEQGSDGNGPPRAVFWISDEQCAFSLPLTCISSTVVLN